MPATTSSQQLTEHEVEQLLARVREFQERNQKYLIMPTMPRSAEDAMVINMANTNA